MGKTAFIYPGQGAQKAGMGKDFYENSAEAKAVYELAEASLGIDVAELCFTENDRLDKTEYTQPALVTTSLAMMAEITKRGIEPDVTAGLSLGEYPAIVTAGGLSTEAAIELSAKRGKLMEEAYPAGKGAMAAVLGLTGEEVEAQIGGVEGVSVANFNCPGQIVITGTKEGVEAAMNTIQAKRIIPLNVSGPFHSPLLKEASEGLKSVLAQTEYKELNLPYVTNVTGEYVTDSREISGLLEVQVTSPVKWEQSVRRMIEEGVTDFVEIGPGRTLTGFIKKISRDVKTYNIDSWESMEQVVTALQEQGR